MHNQPLLPGDHCDNVFPGCFRRYQNRLELLIYIIIVSL